MYVFRTLNLYFCSFYVIVVLVVIAIIVVGERRYDFHQIEESIPVKRRVTILIQRPFNRSTVFSFHGTREGDYNSNDDPRFRFFEESRVLLLPFESPSNANAEAGNDDDDPDRSFTNASGCLRSKK